jgi:chitodextrinase
MIKKAMVLAGFFFSCLLTAESFAAVNCSGLVTWSSAAQYGGGTTVKHNGKSYTSQWWTQGANPETHSGPWQEWKYNDVCSGATSSSSSVRSSSSSSVRSSSSSSTNSGGSCPTWAAGTYYAAGTVVRYNGAFYIAEHANPGYSPTISTWYWDPVSSCPGGNNSSSSSSSAGNDCGSAWYSARLTNYESYPDPGSQECIQYNGCTWAGQFYGLNGVQPESWVAANNIIAVHLKDWNWLGMKTLNLRQGNRRITGKVYDGCSDSDCNGCCTANLGGDGYLIDIEKYTMQRFGSGSGIVEFQVCN